MKEIDMTSQDDLKEFIKLTAETVDLRSSVEMEKLRGEVKECNAATNQKLTELSDRSVKTENKVMELSSRIDTIADRVTASAITKGQWVKIIGMFISSILTAFGISKI